MPLTQEQLTDIRENLKNIVLYLNDVVALIGEESANPYAVRPVQSMLPDKQEKAQQQRAPTGLPTSGAYIIADSSFAQKDIVKAMGFRWASVEKKWWASVKDKAEAQKVAGELEAKKIKWAIFGDLQEPAGFYENGPGEEDDCPF